MPLSQNNINIKKNSIIGASSLVLENVKQNSFYWGIPAKFKKEISDYEKKLSLV